MLIILAILVLVAVVAMFRPSKPQPVINPSPSFSPQPTVFLPFEAEFSIVTNGTVRTFTDSLYHNKSSQVYIVSDKPNSVQVQAPNVTWSDFFATLPMQVTPHCLTTGTGQKFCSNSSSVLKFTLNGIENPQALSSPIRPDDSLLISYEPLL